MSCCSGRVVKNELTLENYVRHDQKYGQQAFIKCRNIKPKSLSICANQKKHNWQLGFFDADGEVYFDTIKLENYACFSSMVRNYWWNGKEGKDKKEGYYSLIKSVKKLQIWDSHINNLLNYVEGKYDAGEHQQIHQLDRNMELRIYSRLKETTVEQLSKYFDNIWCSGATIDLKTENNTACNCNWYQFKNCEGVIPQKLVINAFVEYICLKDAVNEVHIPEIVMEEKADLRSIILNKYGDNEYSLLPHVQTLVIRNNPKVIYDIADYINRRYCTYGSDWKLHQLNKNMKIVIEKPRKTFSAIKEISDYFADVLVDNQHAKDYLCRYINKFQEHFSKYGLETDQAKNLILADYYMELRDQKLNILRSGRKTHQLTIKQKITSQQFVCFHDTDKPVTIYTIVTWDCSDLRCVLQNAYYDGSDSGFFSLLQTAKELEIRSNHTRDNQVLVDLADYIEGKYALNMNWKQEELDKDMKINIYGCKYDQFLSVIPKLKIHFKNVSINHIWILLETENVIDQESDGQYVFTNSRQVSPQNLVINAKLISEWCLILFNNADNEVHIPEITIDEKGCFAAIVRNRWWNNKENNEERSGHYSLLKHVRTLTIRNNPEVVKDLADYVVGKYEIKRSDWKLEQLSKDIKVVIEGPDDAFLYVLRISKYFYSVTIDRKQSNDYIIEQKEWNDPDYRTFRVCFGVHGLFMEPPQFGIEFQKVLKLVDCVYNIRKSMGSIDSLTVKQRLDINQFVCFHGIDKTVSVNQITIDDDGHLRSALQNAYYKNGKAGFFNLLKTVQRLKIYNNEQAAEELADYVDGKYALHPKWGIQTLDRNMKIQLSHYHRSVSLHVAIKLRNYFKNVYIDCIKTPLETENVIDQECEKQYIFTNCSDVNPQKLVVNAKLKGYYDVMIEFNDADGEVCIPEITIGKHGSFGAIVRNEWQNCKNGNKEKHGYYSLLLHVKTLTIQNNPQAVCDLDNYVSENNKIQDSRWKVQKLSKNIIIRINGVKGLDEQINRLKEYFDYIVIDDRKSLRDRCQQMLTHINLKSNDIRQRQAQNNQKQQNIDNSVTSIQNAKRRIERATARLGRRRVRFQEYLALTE